MSNPDQPSLGVVNLQWGHCPICGQEGDLVGPRPWHNSKKMWWHSRPQPDENIAYCGPFQRPMCRADDRCLQEDGHDGPCG